MGCLGGKKYAWYKILLLDTLNIELFQCHSIYIALHSGHIQCKDMTTGYTVWRLDSRQTQISWIYCMIFTCKKTQNVINSFYILCINTGVKGFCRTICNYSSQGIYLGCLRKKCMDDTRLICFYLKPWQTLWTCCVPTVWKRRKSEILLKEGIEERLLIFNEVTRRKVS